MTGWTRIPSDNQYVTDVYVRTLKIDNVCYVQSASAYDWTFNITPTGQAC
jgi:hypothetical protein